MKRTLLLLGLVSLLIAAPAASQDKGAYQQEEQIPSEEQAPPVDPWTPPLDEPPPEAFEPPLDDYPPADDYPPPGDPDEAARPGPYDQMDWQGFVAEAEAQTRGLKLDAEELRARAKESSSDLGLDLGVDPDALLAALAFPERKAVAEPLPLNVERFGRSIHDWLSPRVNGYVFRLTQDGQTIYTGQWGWARRPEHGGIGWTPSVPMHVASVSKVITAIALLHAMDRNGVTLDSPIAPYLPASWPRGPNIDRITFRQLFNHTSGFSVPTTGGDDTAEITLIRQQIAAGVDPARTMYTNVDFGICRVLLAIMNGNVRRDASFLIDDLGWDLVTHQAYEQYVYDHVFAPAGVSGPTHDRRADQALAYAAPPGTGMWDSGSLWDRAGGVGWHISVDQLLAVMNALRSGRIIRNPERIWVEQLGVRGVEDTAGGEIYWKAGAYGSGGRSEFSLIVFLPDNMNLVVFVNSPIGAMNPQQLAAGIRQRYRSSLGV